MTDQTGDAAGRAATPAREVAGGGCSAAERADPRPVLGAGLTQPFRWEIVPDPNPDCTATNALGEAASREQAEEELRRALAGYAAAFGYLYEVTDAVAGAPARIRELARIPVAPRDAKPPVWSSGAAR